MGMNVRDVLSLSPVLPVMVVHDLDSIANMAQALFDGGIRAFEITLRTPQALSAITLLRQTLPPAAIIGAGTITQVQHLQAAIQAGAQFGVSPGFTPTLAQAVSHEALTFLPGVATASEVMQALDWGFDTFKLFPAAAIGGIPLLKSWAGPLAQARFCPTGGITNATASNYLALPNVRCVGGSWLTPTDAVRAGDWARITQLARDTQALRKAA